ncbi:unnamed protein product [Boreogadus saida]
MDYERWLLEDALDFEFDGKGYRFEPEFTQEELREMEARATEAPDAPAEAVPRITGNCWRACGKFRQMPPEVEMRQLLNKPVLETFFWVPKINWKKRPTPEGPNGQLSDRQYRLVAYRVILEWALKDVVED